MKVKHVESVLIGTVILVIVFIVLRQPPASSAFGESIDETRFLNKAQPAQALAAFITPLLTDRLVSDLAIDTSDTAVREFAEQLAPTMFSADRIREDKEKTRAMTSAVAAVLDGTSAEEAYAQFSMADFMTLHDWQVTAANANADMLASMQAFIDASPEEIWQEALPQMRQLLIETRIEEAICTEDVVARERCLLTKHRTISAVLDEEVVLQSEVLGKYRSHLTLLNKVPRS